MSDPWSNNEFAAAVDAYLAMRSAYEQSEPVNKAEVRKQLIDGPLHKRNDKAIEYRFCNISYVLAEEGKGTVSGYVPLGNVGHRGYALIAALLEERGALASDDYSPTYSEEELERRVRRLSLRGPAAQVPAGHDTVSHTEATVRVYARDPKVRAFVLQRANGTCELCAQPAPFQTEAEQPFLEVHHIVPLAEGGSDKVSNAAALCPNCHREAHHGHDRDEIKARLLDRLR